eukprot:UN28000
MPFVSHAIFCPSKKVVLMLVFVCGVWIHFSFLLDQFLDFDLWTNFTLFLGLLVRSV